MTDDKTPYGRWRHPDDRRMTDFTKSTKIAALKVDPQQNDSLAQKGLDHCWLHKLHDCQLSCHNRHLSSSESRRNAPLCHCFQAWRRKYVNALSLGLLSGQISSCFSSSLEDLHLLSSMMLGDGGSCTTTPRNWRWIDENNHIIANIRWARFPNPIASELTNNQSGN